MKVARNAALALMVSSLLVTASAHAEDKTSSDYFADGQKQMAQGPAHYGEACTSFEHALSLSPAVGTKFNLADCYEKTRRLSLALPLFRDVQDITRQAGQMERSDAAKARADALAARVAKITIHAPWLAQHPDATLALDGKAVKADALDTPMAVDFGMHKVTARLGDRETEASTDLEKDGQAETLDIAQPSNPNGAARAAASAPGTSSTASTDASADHPGRSQRIIGGVVGGVGVATIIVGSILALKAKGDYNTAKDGCSPAGCDAAAASAANSARSSANTAGIIDIVGLVAVAAGVVLYVTAPSSDSDSHAASAFGWGRGGLSGSF